MKTKFMGALGLICLVSIFLLSCAPATAPPAEPQPAPRPVPEVEPEKLEWTLVQSWKGTGIKTTEPFTINNQPWSINWASKPEIIGGESMGVLQIFVYSIEEPDIPITLAANTMEEATDISFVYERGTFFLTINAANTNWAVDIYEQQ